MKDAHVGLKRVCDIQQFASIRAAMFELLGPLRASSVLPHEGTIMIKVNLCLLMGPETGATVDPRVAHALVAWLRSETRARRIIIAEADATHLSADMAFRGLGWRSYFHQADPDVEFVNLSTDARVEVPTCYGTTVEMAQSYLEADALISLAKLKTHSLQQITCTMKNLFGALPEKYKVKYHADLTRSICAIASTRRPSLSLVDGLVGMSGKGPTNGYPKICGILIGGTDMVATDHYCARVMGISPRSVPHIREALSVGLGDAGYLAVGDALGAKSLDFKLMPYWEHAVRRFIKGIRERRQGGNAPMSCALGEK